MSTAREDALDIFRYALNASRVAAAMERRCAERWGNGEIDDHRYSLDRYGESADCAWQGRWYVGLSPFCSRLDVMADRFEGSWWLRQREAGRLACGIAFVLRGASESK